MTTINYSSSKQNDFFEMPARDKLSFHIELRLKQIMDARGISIYKMAKISGLRYETVKSYYNDSIYLMDKIVLAIFCSVLKCDINDLEVLVYNDSAKDGETVKFEKSLEEVLI